MKCIQFPTLSIFLILLTNPIFFLHRKTDQSDLNLRFISNVGKKMHGSVLCISFAVEAKIAPSIGLLQHLLVTFEEKNSKTHDIVLSTEPLVQTVNIGVLRSCIFCKKCGDNHRDNAEYSREKCFKY